MRIALVAPPWFPIPPEGYGGIERVVYLLGRGLVELGHDVTVFGRKGRPSKLRTLDLVRGDWSHKLLGPDHMVLWLDYMTRVHNALKDRSFDIIHEHNEAMGAAFAALSSVVQCNWMLPLVNLPVLLKPSLTVRVTTPGVVALDS